MPEYPDQLPAAIRLRLEEFRRRLWWIKAAEALLAAAFGLLAAFLLVFALDRVVDTPVWARVLLLLAGTSLLAVFAPHWIHRWLWKHRRAEQLARLIRRAHPRFGDRLLGAVELASQDARQTALSPVLRAAALGQVAAETERRGTFQDALPASRHRRWGGVVAILVVAALAGFLFAPQAGWNALKRWANPLGDTPRYTFTQLDPLPARLVVAQGEPFSLNLRLHPDSKQMPMSASVAVGADMPFDVRRDGRNFPFRFNGLLTEQQLRFRVGDANPSVRVEPLARPVLSRIEGTVRYPDYLGIGPETVTLEDGRATLVEGGEIALLGEATRPLREVVLLDADDPARETPLCRVEGAVFRPLVSLPAGAVPEPAKPAGAEAGEAPDELVRRFQIHFTDQEGLSPDGPFEFTLRTVRDRAPNIYLDGAGREASILENEVVEFRVIAGDDFGVRRVGFDWTPLPDGGKLNPDDPPAGESVVAPGAPNARRLSQPAVFSPESLKLGPQVLRVRAWAEDYKPGRPRAYSESLLVTIMDRSQHAEMLKRRFGQMMDALEELARREETDHEESKRLDRLPAEAMRDPGTRERVQGQKEAEGKNRQSMEQLRELAKDLFRDALRNKDMEAETMKDWSQMLQDFNGLADQEMPKAEELFGQAADAESRDAQQQDKKMAEAAAQQKNVLEKMRQAMRNANRVEQNMEAGTFVNRLRSAARATKGVAGSLRETVLRGITRDGPTRSRTAGLDSDTLQKEDYTDLQGTAKRQLVTRREITDIAEDLGHFFRRTSKPVYEDLRKEIDQSGIFDAFDRLGLQIGQNLCGRSTPELLAWADKLGAWADKLDPRRQQAGGGGGGGGGGGMDESDFELMLKLLRFVQQTQDIQNSTRRIEGSKQEALPKAEEPRPDGARPPATPPVAPAAVPPVA